MFKYPRRPHIEGSRLQAGDEDLAQVPFARLAGRHPVVEEKADGPNAGVWFNDAGRVQLQSRGHVLTGGPRERQFDLFKAWAARHQDRLFGVLDSRDVLYGEWLYAKHRVFYDALPHYFLAFDVLDTTDGSFLARERGLNMLRGLPVASMPVLSEGPVRGLKPLQSLIGPSAFKTTGWRERLRGKQPVIPNQLRPGVDLFADTPEPVASSA